MSRINAPIPVRKLAAGSDTYERGYHKGDPGGLDAVDTDLAAANIKNGINIFGKAGSTNVRDSSDANAALSDVKNSKTFYAGGGARKTGNLATVAVAPGSNEYPAGYHAGNGGGLTAIDEHLVAENIVDGVTIFGVTGNLPSALAEDALDTALATATCVDNRSQGYRDWHEINAGTDFDIATVTDTYDASCIGVGSGFVYGQDETGTGDFKLRIYMDSVEVAESAPLSGNREVTQIIGTRALSGVDTCKISVHNYNAAAQRYSFYNGDADSGNPYIAGIAVGSIKLA